MEFLSFLVFVLCGGAIVLALEANFANLLLPYDSMLLCILEWPIPITHMTSIRRFYNLWTGGLMRYSTFCLGRVRTP
jgi:hypothetical protein